MEFSQADITEQLNRILMFPPIQNSAILTNFLRFVVEEKLQAREAFIKEYTIATSVLARTRDYNPQSDASVRIHAGRLRKALMAYYTGPGKADRILIDIPKGTYIPQFDLLTSGKAGSGSEGKLSLKPSVAILPLHLHESESLQSLGDGLCDQLCTELTRHRDLSVISYYSSRRIASEENDLQQCGQLLNADYLLTGSIQSDGDLIRIRFQLIKTESQHIVWASSYEKDKASLNTFQIQDDVVRR